jgi:general secretion pathway protein G
MSVGGRIHWWPALAAIVLVVLAIPVVRRMQHTAQVAAASSAIRDMLEPPLEAYRATMNSYPPSSPGLAALREPLPDSGRRWAGPYIKIPIPADPWGRPFRYQSPGRHNPASYDLWSQGPDGIDGTPDDIGNWCCE